MTVRELMDATERLYPNQFGATEKLRWLNEIEQTIYREIVQTHADGSDRAMPAHTDPDAETALLAEDPYSRLYGLWMDAQIAYYNQESDAYTAAAAAFNAAYESYRRQYNRTHMPLRRAGGLRLTGGVL